MEIGSEYTIPTALAVDSGGKEYTASVRVLDEDGNELTVTDGKVTPGAVGDYTVEYTVTYNGRNIELTHKEFDLLFKLLSYPNMIFTKNQLLDEIWGADSASGDDTVKVHISRLRNKIADVEEVDLIAVKGIGYKAVIKA